MNSELGYMSKLMQATGASGESLGEAMGTLHEMTGLSGKDFENFFGTLYSAGQKKGMLSLKEILPSIEQLTKTAKALYGPNATAKQIGDVITAGMFTHSPEAIERGLKMMVSNRKTKSALVAMGFNLAKGFPSIGDIIERATEMSPNRTVRLAYLSGIFGKSTSAMAKLIDESEEYKRITDSTHPEEVFTAANTQARSFSSAINTLNTVFLKFADKALSPAINEFAEQLKSISPEDIAALGKVFEELGKGIGFTVKGLLEIPGAMKEAWGWIKLANEMNPNAGGGRVMNVNGILEQVGSKTAVETELSALNTKKNAGWLMSDKEDKRMKELNTIDSLYNVPQVTNHVYVDSTKIPIAKTVTHVNKTGKQLQPVNP
jgi:hypothetical protein